MAGKFMNENGFTLLENTAFSCPKSNDLDCSSYICDFKDVDTSSETIYSKKKKRNFLHSIAVLYGASLSELTPEVILRTLTTKTSKTVVVLSHNQLDQTDIVDENDTIEDAIAMKEEIESLTLDDTNQSGTCENNNSFDGIFTDSESSANSDTDSSDYEDATKELTTYIMNIKQSKQERISPAKSISFPYKNVIGAATFTKSTSPNNSESLCHLHLIAVQKKFRNLGVGSFLIECMKDSHVTGCNDAVVTYADHDAVSFFKRYEFTDDSILNSKYCSPTDNWLNSIPMCYIPFQEDHNDIKSSSNNKGRFTDQLQTEIDEWSRKALECYQAERILIIKLKNQIRALQEKVSHQEQTIQDLRNENRNLTRQVKPQHNDLDNCVLKEIKTNFQLANPRQCAVDITKLTLSKKDDKDFKQAAAGTNDETLVLDMYLVSTLSNERLIQINNNGFQITDFSNGPFGIGLYFTHHPHLAIKYSEGGCILLVKVALGEILSVVKRDFKRSICSDGNNSILIPGVIENGLHDESTHQYVVFNSNQALPICLIELQKHARPK